MKMVLITSALASLALYLILCNAFDYVQIQGEAAVERVEADVTEAAEMAQ
jgi:hypothetical protein